MSCGIMLLAFSASVGQDVEGMEHILVKLITYTVLITRSTLEFCTGLELQSRIHPLPEHLFPSQPHPRTSNSQARPSPHVVFPTPSPPPQ